MWSIKTTNLLSKKLTKINKFMKTAYKPSIISPIQMIQKKTFDVQDKKHPVREEIAKCVGTYNLTAVVEEDIQTQAIMKHIPGLISFLCTLLRDGKVIAQGYGSSILNSSNKFLLRAVSSAFNSALADATIRATKVLDTFRNPDNSAVSTALNEAYEAKNRNEFIPSTEKQKSYLFELIHTNIADEDERRRWESQIDQLSKDEASEAIQSFKR